MEKKVQTSPPKAETEFQYFKYSDMSVEMQTQEDNDMKILKGRALMNSREKRVTFVQNAPRGARSIEVARGEHSRMVRRPDGNYTLTFRFNAEEKLLRAAMLAEVRNMVNFAAADCNNLKTKKNETERHQKSEKQSE